MHPMLNIAIRAARKAGNFIVQSYEKPTSMKIMQKGTNDFVTNVDLRAESLIVDEIKRFYPNHTILTEEKDVINGTDKSTQWIIDPLDGTTNFTKLFPHFSVSIAVRINNKTEIAVVYDPLRNELFTAELGKGAQLNGYRLRGTIQNQLEGAVIATGFPAKDKSHSSFYLNLVTELFKKCADFRRTGSAALDLAYVAAGRVDGFFEIGLQPWDIAAGELLVRESSGIVCDFNGGSEQLISGNIIAAKPKILNEIYSIIKNVKQHTEK